MRSHATVGRMVALALLWCPAALALAGGRLSNHELDGLEKHRDAVREIMDRAEQKVARSHTVIHGALVARLSREHMLYEGGPGGAKTTLTDAVLAHERAKVFKATLSPDTPMIQLVGGDVLSAGEKGRYQINTEGSMLDHEAAFLDELEKAGGQVFGGLLPVLKERQFRGGNADNNRNAKIETVFAAMNTTIHQLREAVKAKTDDPETAAPFIDRFKLKAYIHNWADILTHQMLIHQQLESDRIEALKRLGRPEAVGHEHFVEPTKIDYALARDLVQSQTIFVPNEELEMAFAELAHELMRENTRVHADSLSRNAANGKKYPHIYYPTVDLNNRSVKEPIKLVLASAWMDLMRSERANDLEKTLAQPIALGPESLWRAHLAFTKLGPGQTRLARGKDGKALGIDWGETINPEGFVETRRAMIEDMNGEHERFATALDAIHKRHQGAIKKAVETRVTRSKLALPEAPFEALLLRERGE